MEGGHFILTREDFREDKMERERNKRH